MYRPAIGRPRVLLVVSHPSVGAGLETILRLERRYEVRRAAKLGDRFWCAFRIMRPEDNVLIADCRQMLALVEMPEGKLLRLPEHWEKYGKTDSVESFKAERRTEMVSGEECIQ